MTPEQIHEGWKQAHISEVRELMSRHGLTLDDLIQPGNNQPMVNTTPTQILPASGYKVAGE